MMNVDMAFEEKKGTGMTVSVYKSANQRQHEVPEIGHGKEGIMASTSQCSEK